MIDEKELFYTANLICNNTFIFNHKWDMEVCRVPFSFEENIIWTKNPFGDPEWTFILNRHKYWIFLGKAYSVSKDIKYFNAFHNQINSWIDNVNIFENEFKDCSRTIEMGIRCINWCKALYIFQEEQILPDNLEEKIFNSLNEQSKVLIGTYDDFRILSNWGVLQNCGLLVFSLYFKEKIDFKYIFNLAMERLEYQCHIQILPDGTHWERSPMYHNEVLNSLLEVSIFLNRSNISIPEFILKSIEKLAYVNLAMIKPNYYQPIQGDSDHTDLREILTRCSGVLGDETLKSLGYSSINFETQWDLDKKSKEIYSALQSKKPLFTSIALKDSGNFYLRDEFKEDGNYLWFSCGPIGSGHGHGENLHFDLTYKGEDFFIDSGRFTYIDDNKERVYLKTPFAHNTTIIDNIPFSTFNNAWEICSSALPLNSYYIFDEKFDYVECGHLGYLSLSNPVITFRKIFYYKPNLWIIIDEFQGNGEHTYNQIFNLHPDKNISLKENSVKISGKNNLFLTFLDKQDIQIEESIFSKEYNFKEKSFKLLTTIKSLNTTTLFTVISDKKLNIEEINVCRGDKSIVPKEEARAIKIEISNTHSLTFLNTTKEINNQKKTYLIENTLFYGKVAFIDSKDNLKTLRVLKY
ncbi:alginate lyase family protein [uncultured Cetobacterium sp.]|uniref:alginate lyase family protein n=1 Tax=uncultured Cetobacterium sp. TaxID=527638 RepID=UPI00260FFB2E|nr:alginate lyase family protein [uncultured Cetobacterium sp.]